MHLWIWPLICNVQYMENWEASIGKACKEIFTRKTKHFTVIIDKMMPKLINEADYTVVVFWTRCMLVRFSCYYETWFLYKRNYSTAKHLTWSSSLSTLALCLRRIFPSPKSPWAENFTPSFVQFILTESPIWVKSRHILWNSDDGICMTASYSCSCIKQ